MKEGWGEIPNQSFCPSISFCCLLDGDDAGWTDDFRAHKNFGIEITPTSAEVGEGAESNRETAVGVSALPSIHIGSSHRSKPTRSNADGVSINKCALPALWKTLCADNALESEVVRNVAILNCLWGAVCVGLQDIDERVVLLRREHQDSASDVKIVRIDRSTKTSEVRICREVRADGLRNIGVVEQTNDGAVDATGDGVANSDTNIAEPLNLGLSNIAVSIHKLLHEVRGEIDSSSIDLSRAIAVVVGVCVESRRSGEIEHRNHDGSTLAVFEVAEVVSEVTDRSETSVERLKCCVACRRHLKFIESHSFSNPLLFIVLVSVLFSPPGLNGLFNSKYII